MAKNQKLSAKRQHKDATVELARLNREMAVKLMELANQTGDVEPLIEAVQALRSAQEYYSPENTPIENAIVQKKLGDILFKVGKNEHHERALKHAVIAYRGALTLASLLGEHKLRASIRQNYELALEYTGEKRIRPGLSLKGVA